MIAGLFVNFPFLLVAVALISVPIIIHLINRMRFKRIRWAAMEFLLKAQKRTRRRLIIEQLLLLALRCLLIALVGLLMLRFVGCGDSNVGGKPSLLIVLLDDSLSMQDLVKGPDGVTRTVFDVAKQDILIKKIGKGLAQSGSGEQVMILPISKIADPGFEPKVFENLHDPQKKKDFEQYVNNLDASALHLSMIDGIKLAKRIMGKTPDSRATLHLISDYRFTDWGSKDGEPLYRELIELVRDNRDMKIRLIDAVLPARGAGYPPSSDNVGITDFRPSARVVGHKTVVKFTITIANYSGKEVDVKLTARNEETGAELLAVNFDVQGAKKDKTRITLSPGSDTIVTFDYGDLKNGGYFFPKGVKAGEARFAHLSVKLVNDQMNPLDNDGILLDNTRHTVVEVREKVPILVIDGNPERGDPAKAEGKDSFILERALGSITGSSYQVEFAKQLNPATALEQPDLAKYPTIFLANVREMNVKQLANLENFVSQGGGVAFYLGPNVNPFYYNKSLYKNGEGIFPAPLQTPFYYPKEGDKELPEKDSDTEQLLIREDKFGDKMSSVPIFNNVFEDPRQRMALRHLPIRRYFKVETNKWKKQPDKVFELASLPNESPASAFNSRVGEMIQADRNVRVSTILADPKLNKYRKQLEAHFAKIQEVVRPDSPIDYKGYHLASRIQALLQDQGSTTAKPPIPDLREFWDKGDENIQALKAELKKLREDVSYGDPFIVMRKFGKGKVVAILSTAGKDWNDWCGGCLGSVVFQPFIWEMQNYLSSLDEDANLMVGADLRFTYDAEQFKGANLKMVRNFHKVRADGGAVADPDKKTEKFGELADGKIVIAMTKHHEPGRYEYVLFDENQPGKVLEKFSQVFNVDTKNEGQLGRIGSDELDRELVAKGNDLSGSKDTIRVVSPGMSDEMLVARQDDFSESPWLFLILLLVLVAEQALAVHLSFHLKNAEDAPPTGVRV